MEAAGPDEETEAGTAKKDLWKNTHFLLSLLLDLIRLLLLSFFSIVGTISNQRQRDQRKPA